MKKSQRTSAKGISTPRDAVPANDGLPVSDLEGHIATAAYFRAQERGFEPGQEVDDWLAAEAEIIGRKPASMEA